MEENSLIAALRKAEAEKFAAVPQEEQIEHAFSDRFRQRMDRLIRLQGKTAWQAVKDPVRRSFLLLLILLLTFGVPPEKNPLFRIVQPIPELSTAAPAEPEPSLPAEPPAEVRIAPDAEKTDPAPEKSPARIKPSAKPEDTLYVPPAAAPSAPETVRAAQETVYTAAPERQSSAWEDAPAADDGFPASEDEAKALLEAVLADSAERCATFLAELNGDQYHVTIVPPDDGPGSAVPNNSIPLTATAPDPTPGTNDSHTHSSASANETVYIAPDPIYTVPVIEPDAVPALDPGDAVTHPMP